MTLEPGMSGRIAQVFAAQQARALVLRRSGAHERVERVRRLLAAFEAHREAIYAAAFADFRKPRAEVDLTEILPVVAEAKHTIRHLAGWMRPHRVPPTMALLGTTAEIRYEPRGVTLIVVPWNYPFTLGFGPLVSALAAGCTAVVKPSELTPACSALTRKIVESAFEPGEVAVFEGDASVAQALLDKPFDHVFFTGSPAVGKIVMAAAAKHLTSVTLELGGKSPTIVDASADLRVAARNVVAGKFTNNGQTCIAPDYILVHESVKDAFVAAVGAQIDRVYGVDADAQRRSPDYCRIVNDRHYARVAGLLDDAVARGAVVAHGGARDAGERFIGPTVLMMGTAGPDTRIMDEEIFGPLLPVLTFRDLGDAIALVNSKPKPLALYVFARAQAVIDRILAETTAGDTCINHTVLHFIHMNLPFGGVNNSGIGKANGFFGFTAFSHERSVLRDRFSVAHWMFAPYTARVKRMIALAIKWFV